MKHFLSLTFIIIYSSSIIAQSNDLSLFSSGGNMSANNDHFLSYSMGEPCITEVFSGDQWVTEGFQQPDAIDVTTSIHSPDGNYTFDVFPNPFSSSLFIRGNIKEECKGKIIDVTGHVWNSLELHPEVLNEWKLPRLLPGLYFIHLQFSNETSLIIPIIKI